MNNPMSAFVDVDQLKKYITYDPETGLFLWKLRTEDMFCPSKTRSAKHVCNVWNSRHAGKPTGSKSNAGYIVITINSKQIMAHKLAWLYVYGEFPNVIDHKNQVRCDNRIDNLRKSSYAENNKNASKRVDNKSGVTGVYWHSTNNRWTARINNNKKQVNLGSFQFKQDAITARKTAEKFYNYSENHGS